MDKVAALRSATASAVPVCAVGCRVQYFDHVATHPQPDTHSPLPTVLCLSLWTLHGAHASTELGLVELSTLRTDRGTDRGVRG